MRFAFPNIECPTASAVFFNDLCACDVIRVAGNDDAFVMMRARLFQQAGAHQGPKAVSAVRRHNAVAQIAGKVGQIPVGAHGGRPPARRWFPAYP